MLDRGLNVIVLSILMSNISLCFPDRLLVYRPIDWKQILEDLMSELGRKIFRVRWSLRENATSFAFYRS